MFKMPKNSDRVAYDKYQMAECRSTLTMTFRAHKSTQRRNFSMKRKLFMTRIYAARISLLRPPDHSNRLRPFRSSRDGAASASVSSEYVREIHDNARQNFPPLRFSLGKAAVCQCDRRRHPTRRQATTARRTACIKSQIMFDLRVL